ncbi:FitA-like ribbon-helix-helix domain-containing protein [Deferrisoma camini]|uniref:FitA-like ribbon-helix-helix domain-containing protein n=1 Tax=Deferrisoma camini TaxID=1035120 RepID=UPI00046D0153|nr:Arc family DNA-binding protein [Deferrisoma camini]
MPTTVTLKNVPEGLYERLKESARAHHRSINGEAIACLERVLLPNAVVPEERIERARRLRAGLRSEAFDAGEIAAAIDEGRP